MCANCKYFIVHNVILCLQSLMHKMHVNAEWPVGGGDDKAVVMVMCNRQEWLVDLVREPGMLLPLKSDVIAQAPYLNRMSGHASGEQSPTPTSCNYTLPYRLPVTHVGV